MADLIDRQDVPDTNVGDMISRQAAIDATWEEPSYTDPLNVLTEVRDRIKALPSADAVEVVRCKDCYHYDEESEKCILNNSEMKPMDYCSYGSK